MMTQKLVRLIYGAPTDKCAITVRLGIAKGFFRDEGIDLAVRVIYGGPELAAAYSSGEIPFGEMGSPPCVTAIGKGANISIIGGGVRRKAHMYVGVRKDIPDWNGLKGRRIGLLSRGSCPEWFLRSMLIARCIDPDSDVQLVGLHEDYSRVVDVMQEGRIDAALAVEPAMAIGEERGVLRVIAAVYDEPSIPPIQWIVRVGNRKFAESNHSLVEAALRACVRSSQYAANHVDELIDFAAKHYGLAPGTARRAMLRDFSELHFAGEIDFRGLENVLELQLRLGAIDKPLLLADVLNECFLSSKLPSEKCAGNSVELHG
jgi:NitT/TauT family transport system substrate-binding protein